MPVEYPDLDALKGQHNDIRFEQMQQTAEIIKEGMKGDHEVFAAVRDNRYDLSSRVENAADRSDAKFAALADRFFTVARDTADLKSQVTQTISEVRLAGEKTAQAGEIASLRTQIEGQRNTQYLSDKIGVEGDRTRTLINELKYGDLNRALIERNSELVDERYGRRHWEHAAGQSQFAAVNTQLQAFGSQLQETRQGMVNFGTMAGVGQTSSSNNV